MKASRIKKLNEVQSSGAISHLAPENLLVDATRCPECGAALDTGARESAAKRAEQFMKDAQNVRSDVYAAIPLFSCAIELAAEAALPRLRAEALWWRGKCYERLEILDRALFDYEDAYRFAPGNDDYLMSMADLRSDLDHEKRRRSRKRGKK
jgi:tetratricopeptide (TPR) repeat protein